MDIVNKSYFNVIKYSIIVTGLSRHHPMWFNFLAKSFTFFLIFSLLSAQIAGFVKVYGDIDLVLGCCPPICYSSISAIIYVNSNLHVKQINIVFEKIREDWNLLTSESELDILHKYGRKCRAYNLLYTYGLFIQVVLYHSAHGIPLLINILKKNNKPKPLMLPVECGLDSEKYFGLITLHSYVFGYFSTTGIATGGTLLVMFLEHACGIFDIIGHKLIHAIKENINSTNKVVSKKKFRQEIKICVAMHKRIVLFITDIQNVFSTAYLFVYGIKIILLSVTAVQFVMSTKNTENRVRFGFFGLFQVMHIFFLTIPTQHLLDNSLNLSTCIYNNTDWYHLPDESKKLLLIIMRKGSQPATFTVGKIFVPSIQFFTKVLQTSVSYFTVLRSVQE